MTLAVLDRFGGLIPRAGREVLPVNAASVAKNCLLLSGELRGLHAPRKIADLTSELSDVASVFRVRNLPNPDIWVSFPEKGTSFLKGVLKNDAYNRYYWTTPGEVPQMNTYARLDNGDPSYILGVPAPVAAPVATPDASGTGDLYTRAYAYTFVSTFGEEGPLSPLVVETGRPDDVWDLSGMDITIPDIANRAEPFTKRIYRSVSGNIGTTLFLVAEIPLAQATYSDTFTDAEVVLNTQNESATWFPPPDGLEGIITHPNGFMVGFTGRDLYFSEPYRPHAWPADYVVSTEHPIVGLGIYGNSIAVLTEGYPSVATGSHPSTISLADSEFSEPCLSKYGIVSMPFGVYYPGPNGLMIVNSQGIQNATKGLLTKDEWQLNYFPNLLNGARWQDFYIAWYTDTQGFMFAPSEPQAAFTELDRYWFQEFVNTDPETGELISLNDKLVYLWNPPDGLPINYVWRSKEFRIPTPCNFSAYRIYWDANTITIEGVEDVIAYNEARMEYPLNTFNMHTYNSGDIYDIDPVVVEDKMPLGGSPLIDTEIGLGDNKLTFKVYANGVLKYANTVANEQVFRLPAGYKDDRYTFELEGNVNVRFALIGTSPRELKNA